jgi:peptidoglycan-N-acetylglucosamine deacetylase
MAGFGSQRSRSGVTEGWGKGVRNTLRVCLTLGPGRGFPARSDPPLGPRRTPSGGKLAVAGRGSPLDGEHAGRTRTETPIKIIAVIAHLLAPHVPRAAAGLRIPRRLSADGVALTFDDGPHPEGTPAVLEVLAEAELSATFFLVGEQVERRPALAAEIAQRGHLVGLHAYRHRPQPALPRRVVEDDLARGAAAIETAVGRSLAWHRPPYGLYSPAGLAWVRERGMNPLLWSKWGKDWRRLTTPERIARRATAGVHAGDVILLHDADFYSAKGSHERTVEALKLVVRELKRQKIGTVLPL